MTRVLIAHSYPVTRTGLRGVLAQAPGMEVVAEASEGAEALQLIQQFRPDVVLLDGRLSGALDAIAVAERISTAGWGTRVLGLNAANDDGQIYRLWRAGAAGCVSIAARLEAIVQAVAAVARGERLWTAEQVARARRWQEDIGSRLETLTEREGQILILIVEALSDRQIAERLSLSQNTVHWHVRNVLSKLGLKTRQEAIVFLLRKGSEVTVRAPNHQS
jgi:DNA-binding NarL/FixJ family response regulator